MQSPRVASVEFRELELVHELQEEVIGRMQVLQRKVPIDGGLQFRGVDPFRDLGNLANANEASIADDPRQKRLFRWPRPGIFDIPRLKGVEKARETVDRREDFDQGDVVLSGQECAQGFAVVRLRLWRREMERVL